MPIKMPAIPQYVTVHLGPPDSKARNVTMLFSDYIKNVASFANYPTWPDSAIVANIYAQISFALYRIHNDHYRSRGYNFDLTNAPPDDQAFVYKKEIFGNISRIVDEIFNDYVVKGNKGEPYFTQYCSEAGGTCTGLSQWGSVALAKSGYTPYQILQHYYGNDIGIVRNAPINADVESYPGVPLQLGSWGNDVRKMQRELNRISVNYPAIPKVPIGIGVYDEATRSAVSKFQEIFDLPVDGIIGKATWYKIQFTYNIVNKFHEPYLEGLSSTDVEELYKNEYRLGDSDDFVGILQFYLNFISSIYNNLPPVNVDGVFNSNTRDAVAAFQKEYGLPDNGVADRDTWSKIQQVYLSIMNALPKALSPAQQQYYPGYFITTGAAPKMVKQLQTYLRFIAQNDKAIPLAPVDGVYGPGTKAVVLAFQKQAGATQSGYVGPLTWAAIVDRYNKLKSKPVLK